MERIPGRGYFPDLAKSLFISDTPGQEEATRREFAVKKLLLNFGSGSRYLGAYLDLRKSWWHGSNPKWRHGTTVLNASVKFPDDTPSRLIPDWECHCISSGSTCKGTSLDLALFWVPLRRP